MTRVVQCVVWVLLLSLSSCTGLYELSLMALETSRHVRSSAVEGEGGKEESGACGY